MVVWKPKSLSSSVIFLSTLLFAGGDGDWDGQRQRHLGAGRGFHGEHAALDVFDGGGGDVVVVGRDKVNAGVVKGDGGFGVIG